MPTGTANYTGTHAWDVNSILNYVLGMHGTATPALNGNPEFLRTGGRYLEAPGSASGILDMVMWTDERGYLTPHIKTVTLFSTTTAGTQTTSTGTAVEGLHAMKSVLVMVDFNATGGTSASNTLDLLLDSQLFGTTWVNIARSTLMVGPQGAIFTMPRIEGSGIYTPFSGTGLTGLANAGVIRAIGFGDNMRVRYTVGSNATSSCTFTVYLSAIG